MKTIADSPDSRKYETGWDVLRVLACLMVVVIHARNPYTYGADGALDPWAAFFIVAARAGVPLFVMLSCALLLPLRQGVGDFLKRRFWRVAAPFAVWSAIFAFIPLPADLTGYAPVYEGLTPPAGAPLWQEALYGVLAIPVTFTGKTCPYWFLYIILGLYLVMPIVSPWLRQASLRQLGLFVGVWGLTLAYPFLAYAGISELHGVCAWNRIGMGYYLTGYIGYLLLACFIIRADRLSARGAALTGAGLFALGLVPTFLGALWLAPTDSAADKIMLERVIDFFSPAVVLMTAGCFMAIRRVRLPAWAAALFRRLASRSFAIFLVHWLFAVYGWGFFAGLELPTWLGMPVLTAAIFLCSWAVAEAIALLPRPAARLLGID